MCYSGIMSMDDQAFDELKQSAAEGGRILGGEQEPSRKAIVLSNGTLKDPVTGHFMPGSKPATAIGSSERGRELARRKHELAAIAARQALAQRAEKHGVQRSPVAAVGLLAGKAYDAALAGFEGDHVILADGAEYDKPDRRGAVEAGKFALRLADMLPADEKQQQSAPTITVSISGEPARKLAERWGITLDE